MKTKILLVGLLLIVPYVVLAEQGDLPTKSSGPYVGIGRGIQHD